MEINEHKMTQEQSIEFIKDLESYGLLKTIKADESLCFEVKFPCPLCESNIIVIQCGEGFEIICKRYGELVSFRGM